MTPASPTPAECVALIVRGLTQAVVTRNLLGLLSQALTALIIARLRGIAQRVAGLADRVARGTYVLRRPASRRASGPRPGRPAGLPQASGWLRPLVPEALAFGSQLETLFRDEAMAALLAAAPVSLGRPLRSLCRMLGVTPPPVLAPPARPRPARDRTPAKRVAPRTAPPPRPPVQTPSWWVEPPRRTRWSFGRRRDPPAQG